MKVAV